MLNQPVDPHHHGLGRLGRDHDAHALFNSLPHRYAFVRTATPALPLPIRVLAGFLVNVLSGKHRSHTRPPRLIWRVSAMRAASSARVSIRAVSMLFSP